MSIFEAILSVISIIFILGGIIAVIRGHDGLDRGAGLLTLAYAVMVIVYVCMRG